MWWLAAHGKFICSRECGGSGQIRPILLDQNGIFYDLDNTLCLRVLHRVYWLPSCACGPVEAGTR